MMKLLIASYDMEVGGVERSMAAMLNTFNYKKYDVNVMLYRHQGEFMALLAKEAELLGEVPQYATFRKSIKELLKEGRVVIGAARLLSKLHAFAIGRAKRMAEPGYYQMQLMWRYVLPLLPKADIEYDAAISYLWPHYYVADKVQAKLKVAWIHTDYATVETNVRLDLQMWNKFDYIIAVSEACRESFLGKYGSLREKVIVLENINSPEFIRSMSAQALPNPMQQDQRFKLLTVARLSHAKGIDQAVRALKLLKDKGLRNLAWYIVGYGGDQPLIERLIAELDMADCFYLLGKQINPYPYMQACDLYVQPSRYEGKAVTVTEAKILGKPILITGYATAASQVNHGQDGYITELSVEGIAAGIERLYEDHDLRQHLESHCKQHNYSNESELDKLYGLLEGRKAGSAGES